jgi:ParB family transcriptional regulator, chromosome partitioning protein
MTTPKYSARNNDTTPEERAVAVLLPLASIDSSPLNPRTRFNDEDLQRLANSLQADGLLQPIVVTPAGDRYRIVAGERRWRAAQRLSWTEIPAIVRTDVDDRTLIRLALLENLARTDLDPLEEADGYRQLQDLGMTQAAIAAAVHRSQPAIANTIRLLKLPKAVQDLVQAGKLTPSHGVALLRYESVP